MLNKIGGRKIAAGIIALLCGIACLLLKGDVPAGFLTLLQTLFGGFVLGNVGEHVAGAFRAQQEDSEEAAPPDPAILYISSKMDKLDNDINSLKDGLGVANASLQTTQQAVSFIINKAFPKG